MATATLGRMKGVVQAKLLLGQGIQVPAGLAQPQVLVLLLMSAMLSRGAKEEGGGEGKGKEAGEGEEEKLLKTEKHFSQSWQICVFECSHLSIQ